MQEATEQRSQQCAVAALVEDVAADDQIEPSQLSAVCSPWQIAVNRHRQLVEAGVVGQELFGERMMITGGDIGTAACKHQAGQCQAAAEFEHALAADVDLGDRLRQSAARRPDLPEQAPLGGGNAGATGLALGIGVLLLIAQGADPIIETAQRDAGDARHIARHGRTSG